VAAAPPTCYHAVGVRLFHRRRPALQPLGEAEAYARCHGARSHEIVSIERLPPEPVARVPAGALTGESLRQAFEARLGSRLRSRAYLR
jgi:hypothetical protein